MRAGELVRGQRSGPSTIHHPLSTISPSTLHSPLPAFRIPHHAAVERIAFDRLAAGLGDQRAELVDGSDSGEVAPAS